MPSDILKIKEKIKQKRKNKTIPFQTNKVKSSFFLKNLNRFLGLVVFTLITLIMLKGNSKFRSFFYHHVFDSNFSFAKINELYESHFGSSIPFKETFKNKLAPVFNETLKYQEANKYKDGVKLVVDNNYLVPALKKGIVIFIGDKEEYKNTIIVQQSDGIDVWYSNLDNIPLKLYDFVKEGSLIGETIDNNLYLVFKKDGKIIDYKEHL